MAPNSGDPKMLGVRTFPAFL